jgi:hypothetical protein
MGWSFDFSVYGIVEARRACRVWMSELHFGPRVAFGVVYPQTWRLIFVSRPPHLNRAGNMVAEIH